MELNEYQILASRTIAKNMNEQDMEMHALRGMVGEVGELHSIYQKIYQVHMADRTHQKKAIGDLLWFIAEYCTSKDWTLDDVASTNIDKLKARYPMGFSADNSIHRKEGDI